MTLAFLLVPESRDPAVPPLDCLGLAISIAMLGVLVYTIIEAPDRGWRGRTLAGFAGPPVLLAVFVWWSARPSTDARRPAVHGTALQRRRAAVTVAFFALFGFIFLITQYFQFVAVRAARRPAPGSCRWRSAIAVASVAGVLLAAAGRHQRGGRHRAGCGSGPPSRGSRRSSAATPYWAVIVAADDPHGRRPRADLAAPATESIMRVVPPYSAGVGSAINEPPANWARRSASPSSAQVISSIFGSRSARAAPSPPAGKAP